MPPLDMQTQCTGAVASGTLGQQHKQQQHQQQNKVPPSPTASSSSSPSMDSLRSLAEAAAASPKSVLMSPEAAGERRRSRALKLKQTRSRNALAAAAAAAARNQVYSSAEESDDDVSLWGWVSEGGAETGLLYSYVFQECATFCLALKSGVHQKFGMCVFEAFSQQAVS